MDKNFVHIVEIILDRFQELPCKKNLVTLCELDLRQRRLVGFRQIGGQL